MDARRDTRNGLAGYLGGLTTTQGAGAGGPFRLLPWQRRFLSGFSATVGDVALSVSRGNGKSTLIAGIACAAVEPGGPLVQARAEVVIIASSFSQGRVVYEHVLAFLRAKGHNLDQRKVWRLQDSQNAATVEHRATGARVRCLGSDPSRAHGLAPSLAIADEPAQWPGSTSDRMLAAVRTSMGKVPGSRMIAIGTRPVGDATWFGRMLAGGCDYAQSHEAHEDDPPFQRRTWAKANPSLSIMPDLENRIRKEAADARKDSSLLAGFRALRLNMGTEDTEQATLLDANTWQAIEGEAERRGPYALGIDLGGSAAMSAASAYWPDTGAFDAFACFGDIPDLRERGLRDGIGRRYMDMKARDEIILASGRVPDIKVLLGEVLARWGPPAGIVADRWKAPELQDALEASRFPMASLLYRGQGFKDGAEDVRDFRVAVLQGRVTPGRSLLMRSAIGEARVTGDTAGNWKLSKQTEGGRRLRARDDAASSAILAVAAGERQARSSASGGGPGVVVI